MIRVFVLILCAVLYLCDSYEIQCPHISQWNYSKESFQCSKKYLCLYNNHKEEYEEQCRDEHENVKPGYTYFFSPNPDKVECSPEYYQPVVFISDGNSQCTFKKSECKEEGQVIATNGSTTTDRTCRCDYTKNYVYVTPPNDICSCLPSEEDCSCYHRPCTGDNDIMISDYKCVPKVMEPVKEQMKCPIINTSSVSPTETPPKATTLGKQCSETKISAKLPVSPIIGLFILFAILIAFVLCINVRPHVTITEAVYRKDLIVTEHCGQNITVIEGERLQLQYKFKSILPVKSITWQHRDLDGNIQNVNSNTDQTSSVTSPLTIDNIKSSHSGRYECILTNIIGLSNTSYNCCPSFIKNLHACRPEDNNYVDINVCSLPDRYQTVSVFKRKNGILEINNQNYTRIMWFKHEDPLTSIKPNDKYEFTKRSPSLTIKAADYLDVGIYVCILVDSHGNVESVGFKFRVKPQEDTYNQMLQHRNDQTYVKTADVNRALECLQKDGSVVITGRIGTGKSKLILQLASLCEKDDYLPYRVGLSNPVLEDFGHSKILCIIDCNEYKSRDPDQMKTLLTDLGNQENVRMIFTCTSIGFTRIRTILQERNILKKENVIDLNESLTQDEKKEILQKHMTANNIVESSSAESNFKSNEILQKNDIQVKFDSETIGDIIKTEPLYGFPLTAVKFCSDRKSLYLGEQYFTNLPEPLEIEIFQLAKTEGFDESALNKKMKFCVLTYIAVDENECLDKRDINHQRFTELLQVLFSTNIRDNDINTMVKDAIQDLEGTFIIDKGGKYVFIHQSVLTTLYASNEYFTHHLIQKGSLCEIKKFIRSSKYRDKEREMICIRLSEQIIHKTLCRRLITEASKGGDVVTDVGRYIYEQFIKFKDDKFCGNLISHLESRIWCDKQAERKPLSTQHEDQVDKDTDPDILFWQTVLLIYELTDHGKDPWFLGKDKVTDKSKGRWSHHLKNIPDIILLCGLVTTCIEKRQDNTSKEKLLKQFKSTLDHDYEQFLKSMQQRVDKYGNTFFHYLVVLSEDEEACLILEVRGKLLTKENRYLFGRPNKMDLTPLAMAAYVGKLKLFTLLVDKTRQNDIEKSKDGLHKLTEEGRTFKHHNTKNKIDNKMSYNFEEGILRYIQYGTEQDFLDILDLHKTTNLKKKIMRNAT